jgi:hypothetical protein
MLESELVLEIVGLGKKAVVVLKQRKLHYQYYKCRSNHYTGDTALQLAYSYHSPFDLVNIC